MRIFVYGSLRQGQKHAGLVADLPATPGRARGWLWLQPEGYPVLVPDPDGPEIAGEVLEGVDPARMEALDRFEGTDVGLYRRVTLPVQVGSVFVNCEVYALPEAEAAARGCTPLETRDWSAPGALPPWPPVT